MTARRLGGLALAALLAACGPANWSREQRYDLPEELKEASGLAVAGPDSVFTHDDEHAIVYEVGLRDGKVLRAFALGEPTIDGDFEDIAIAGGRVFLVTSDGLIYSALPGKNGERVAYQVYDSGVGTRCEIEGLSNAPTPGDLLLMCKRFRGHGDKDRIEIHRWHIGSDRAEAKPFLSVPFDGLLDKEEWPDFRPSGLAYDPKCGQLYIVSARSHTVLILNLSGQLLGHHRLKASRHPQAEGITLMPDGRLVLADEGPGNRPGQITVYDGPKACGSS